MPALPLDSAPIFAPTSTQTPNRHSFPIPPMVSGGRDHPSGPRNPDLSIEAPAPPVHRLRLLAPNRASTLMTSATAGPDASAASNEKNARARERTFVPHMLPLLLLSCARTVEFACSDLHHDLLQCRSIP